MTDPIINLHEGDDAWGVCPFCAVQLGATVEQRQAHYVTVHGYMEIATQVDYAGRSVSLELERPQLVHGPVTFYQQDPAKNPQAECYELWCVASSRGLFFLRMIHAWWLNAEKRAWCLSHVLSQPCKTKFEVVAEFDAETKRLEGQGWDYKLKPGFDSRLGIPREIRIPSVLDTQRTDR
jgi:hypothetical protein